MLGVMLAALATHDARAEDEPAEQRQYQIKNQKISVIVTPPASTDEQVQRLREKQQTLDESVWLDEQRAQEYEQSVVHIWDALRMAQDKFAVAASLEFETLTLPGIETATNIENGIQVARSTGDGPPLDPRAWRQWLDAMYDQAYQLVDSEWHQSRFEWNDGKNPASTFDFVLNITNSTLDHRWHVKGVADITWDSNANAQGRHTPNTIRVRDVTIMNRAATDAFEPAGKTKINGLTIIAYDLDGDGRSEIILPTDAGILWNQGGHQFERKPLFDMPEQQAAEPLDGGLVADFTGDGIPDLVSIAVRANSEHPGFSVGYDGENPVVVLFRGLQNGTFDPDGAPVLATPLNIGDFSAFTAGDIDRDGDLDLWVAQYKPPYLGGVLPDPYFDANDGQPSYLLINEGNGHFVETTQSVISRLEDADYTGHSLAMLGRIGAVLQQRVQVRFVPETKTKSIHNRNKKKSTK